MADALSNRANPSRAARAKSTKVPASQTASDVARDNEPEVRRRGRPKKGERHVETIYRMQIRLSEKGFERVAKIQSLTEATSHADVVRDALRLYDEVIDAIETGFEVRVIDPRNARAPSRPLRNLKT